MKVLVTGGAGFIGSNLVRKLVEKSNVEKVVIVDLLTYAGHLTNLQEINKDKLELIIGDVANGQLMDNVIDDINFVYHLAAETHVTRSIYDNYQFFHTDVLGTQSLANCILRQSTKQNSQIPLVHISTSEVYGTAETDLMDEMHPLNPRSPYAAAKAGADRLIYSYAKTYNLNSLIIRPFNQFGQYQHPEKLIPRFITNAICGDPLPVHGDGSTQRDWTHVDDTTDFLASLIDKDLSGFQGDVFNIGADNSIPINKIANLVSEQFPDCKKIHIDDRPGQVERHTCNSSKARKLLDWKVTKNLDSSIAELVEWYKNNRNIWEPHMLAKDIELEIVPGKKIRH